MIDFILHWLVDIGDKSHMPGIVLILAVTFVVGFLFLLDHSNKQYPKDHVKQYDASRFCPICKATLEVKTSDVRVRYDPVTGLEVGHVIYYKTCPKHGASHFRMARGYHDEYYLLSKQEQRRLDDIASMV